MADLPFNKISDVVRVIGADPSNGDETEFIKVDQFQDIHSVDTPVTGGLHGSVNVSTTAVELKIGASKLVGRKFISIQPKGSKLYFGYSSAVTSLTGTEVFKNQSLFIPVGPDQNFWLISDSVLGIDVRITES